MTLRPGADADNLGPADFLCNFCGRSWADDLPMIEGHQGNLICGRCLSVAYAEVALHRGGEADPGPADQPNCVMCLEHRTERRWASPMITGQAICVRCIRQAATALERDADSGWRKQE